MNSLEIAIHNLFQENASTEFVCRELLSKYDKNEIISSDELESLSHFFISIGQIELLKKFYLRCLRLKKINQLPIGFLAEMLQKNQTDWNESTVAFFDYLIQVSKEESTYLKSNLLSYYFNEIPKKIAEAHQKFKESQLELKKQLIEQLSKNRIYQLSDQEENVLKQLVRLFPHDIEIGILKQAHLERKADQILSKFSNQKDLNNYKFKSHPYKQGSAETQAIEMVEFQIRNILKSDTDKNQQLKAEFYNLAIFTFQINLFELTLEVLERCPENKSSLWLKAETLFECGRHLDLLKLIEKLESDSDYTADDASGAIYLKALAYHGLGQTELAQRFLSALAQNVPNYRSTEAYLQEWARK